MKESENDIYNMRGINDNRLLSSPIYSPIPQFLEHKFIYGELPKLLVNVPF